VDSDLFFTFQCHFNIFLRKGSKEYSQDEEARLLLTNDFVLYVRVKQ